MPKPVCHGNPSSHMCSSSTYKHLLKEKYTAGWMACDLQGILLSFKYPSKYYFGLKYFFQVFFLPVWVTPSSEAKLVPCSLLSKWSSNDLDKAQSLVFTWQGSGVASWLGKLKKNQLVFYSFKCTAAVPAVISHPLYRHKKRDVFPSSYPRWIFAQSSHWPLNPSVHVSTIKPHNAEVALSSSASAQPRKGFNSSFFLHCFITAMS